MCYKFEEIHQKVKSFYYGIIRSVISWIWSQFAMARLIENRRTNSFINQTASLILFLFLISGCTSTGEKPENLVVSAEQTALQQTQDAIEGAKATIDPNSIRLTEDVLGTQRAEIYERVQATEDGLVSAGTQVSESNLAAQQTAAAAMTETAQAVDLKSNLVWKADFEPGNLSQFKEKGDFLNQGSGTYSMINFAHRGNFAVSLTIDTNAPTESGSHAAYLFFWRQLPEDAYYYSVWYYFPNQIHVREWWTIMQWKSTYDGNTDHSVRVFAIGVEDTPDGLRLSLNQRPTPVEVGSNSVVHSQDVAFFPINQWVHVEAYYKRGINNTGQVILWQDEVELLNLNGVNTVFSDETILWSVHNYSNGLDPNPVSIYVDDIAISKVRIGARDLP